MRKISVLLVAALAVAFCYGTAFGQINSTKTAVGMNDSVSVFSASLETLEDFKAIPGMTAKIKMPEQKDLVFDVSLQCGLMTNTLVKSKGGDKNTATAAASIKVRVEVKDIDGNSFNPPKYASPGADATGLGVTFAARTQSLTAKLQGIIRDCAVDEGGELTEVPELDLGGHNYCLDPEEIGLVLDTMNANAFNFLYENLGSGEYTVEVQAKIMDGEGTVVSDNTDPNYDLGTADSLATIGLGSMIIDDVRLDNNK